MNEQELMKRHRTKLKQKKKKTVNQSNKWDANQQREKKKLISKICVVRTGRYDNNNKKQQQIQQCKCYELLNSEVGFGRKKNASNSIVLLHKKNMFSRTAVNSNIRQIAQPHKVVHVVNSLCSTQPLQNRPRHSISSRQINDILEMI